jgi:hypothetical protein
MATVQFITHGETAMTAALTLFERLSDSNLADYLEDQVDPYLKGRVADRFAAEGDDAVGMWLPLSPATEQIRQSRGYGGAHPINVRTREMLNYILTGQADVSGTGDGQMISFPSNGGPSPVMDKIKTAQQGKPDPNTPPRPVVALSDTDERDIMISLEEYLMEGLI